ncbi:hypothetical protein PAXRUDRAFT_138044 [Paxillus rubicundulus Ve08.2h10]|uniref:DUF6593 domain-containing protein n=1 Tax=Paxillus rubicundulus Ve08.2h10 TaxID=930991 RepID=A0A0D0DSS3_9AGAM|nr:hypothetical protein PAXRUDRAFT_138044 [Paxillus rubicundulus Ve08.2h10]
MYGTNPFSAEEAWNSGSGNTGGAPSVFGALPYPPSSTNQVSLNELVTFRFTSFNPTILNCTVIGPNNETYFRVVTDVSMQGYTVLKNSQGSNIALVEWQTHPNVEARGVAAKQPVAQWLKLSSDRSSRYMVHNGVGYSWAPSDRFLHLFVTGTSDWLARVSKTSDSVVLEVTHRAMQLGLLDAAILGTVVLQCGKNID